MRAHLCRVKRKILRLGNNCRRESTALFMSVRDRDGKEVSNADNAVNIVLFSLADPRPAMFMETFLYEKNTEFDATHPAVFLFRHFHAGCVCLW